MRRLGTSSGIAVIGVLAVVFISDAFDLLDRKGYTLVLSGILTRRNELPRRETGLLLGKLSPLYTYASRRECQIKGCN
jgi:hypothetical protein